MSEKNPWVVQPSNKWTATLVATEETQRLYNLEPTTAGLAAGWTPERFQKALDGECEGDECLERQEEDGGDCLLLFDDVVVGRLELLDTFSEEFVVDSLDKIEDDSVVDDVNDCES
jgi:hypothetical protein